MTFADTEISRAVKDGRIGLKPFWETQLNPASYDLTLHPFLKITRGEVHRLPDGRWTSPEVLDLWDRTALPSYSKEHILYQDEPSYDIQPGEFLLACTQEYVKIGPEVVGRVEGKSSLARVGLVVHVTGGFIDPGFEGQITLEIANLFPRPVRLYSGMRIAQIAFSMVQGKVLEPYNQTGHYNHQQGPVESRYIYDETPPTLYQCMSCDWKGVYSDWEHDTGEERFCPECHDPKMVCPQDHCLECGAST